MDHTEQTIAGLEKLVERVPYKIWQFSHEELDTKPAPGKWSKKEILGHLCDSAWHNIQRLIRVQYEENPYIIYDQDNWVRLQNYQEKPSEEIVVLWIALHKQMVHVMKGFPKSKLDSTIDVGKEVTAGFIITDYLVHQLHHFKQIFGHLYEDIE